MMTKEEKAQELLKKYAAGQVTPAERERVESWYASYENNEPEIAGEKKAAIGAAIFEKLKQEMQVQPKVLRLSAWFKAAKIAAVLLLISVLGVLLWSIAGKKAQQQELAAISTTAAQKKKIILADGSEIDLAPSSRLFYPVKFAAKSRVITLSEGEAFFKIAHEESRPFTVKTSNGLQTKVLGTSFRIQARHSSPTIKIIVATGKVAVGNAQQVFGILVKGQEITYDKKEERALIAYTPAPVYVNLVFERETLDEVCSKLEYAYGIKIYLQGHALNKLKCTATFNTKQNPEEIMELLCSLHRLKFRKSDDHKTFNVYQK